MAVALKDVTGFRGEKLVELCLTDYSSFSSPLFWPGFLGDKWPGIDFYVELLEVPSKRLYFLGQAKATTLSMTSTNLRISATRSDIDALLEFPGPTYLFGIHEPTKRVFVRSVHSGTPSKAITRIPLAYELTGLNLQKLHDEVAAFWTSGNYKPSTSDFG